MGYTLAFPLVEASTPVVVALLLVVATFAWAWASLVASVVVKACTLLVELKQFDHRVHHLLLVANLVEDLSCYSATKEVVVVNTMGFASG